MKTVTKNPPDFPDNLPLLPEPPKGKKWVYRDLGWDNDGLPAHYMVNGIGSGSWSGWTGLSYIPYGEAGSYYAELVDEEPDVFSKEYQAELAKQWVLEGGFEREHYVDSLNEWRNSKEDWWHKSIIYRRKPQPTQEELDQQKVKELSKYAWKDSWNPSSTIEEAIAKAIQYGRETK